MPEARNKSDNGTRYSAKNPLKIILLFEGTDNEPRKNPSAISELNYKYKLENGVRVKDNDRLINDISQGQVVNLVTGSGTTGFWPFNKFRSWIGYDSWKKVFEQYKWLSTCIDDNSLDAQSVQIFIFGFSRGAYQALMFTDVLNKVGLSSKWGKSDLCKKYVSPASSIPDEEQFSIEYLGLIDTVSATIDLKLHTDRLIILKWFPSSVHRGLGKIYKWLYSFFCKWSRVNLYSIPGNVKRWRHALALNEYRSRFQPKIFNGTPDQEQWFLGAHADVGKGYNGGPNKASNSKPCQTHTKAFGNRVVRWIIEPVSSKLQCHPANDLSVWTTKPILSLDYINLVCFFPWLIHDSYNEKSNLGGVTNYRRNRDWNHYHCSVTVAYELLALPYFPKIDVKVSKLNYRQKEGGNQKQSISMQDCMKNLIDPQMSGEVWFPACCVERNRDEIEKIVEKLWGTLSQHHRGIYDQLVAKGILSHPFGEEQVRIIDYCVRKKMGLSP